MTAYVSLLLRSSFERPVGEESALVYEHVEERGEVLLDRETDEDDESDKRRSALYQSLFHRDA